MYAEQQKHDSGSKTRMVSYRQIFVTTDKTQKRSGLTSVSYRRRSQFLGRLQTTNGGRCPVPKGSTNRKQTRCPFIASCVGGHQRGFRQRPRMTMFTPIETIQNIQIFQGDLLTTLIKLNKDQGLLYIYTLMRKH